MRRALLIVLAITVLAIAGCGPSEPVTPDLANPFVGGTGALAVSLAEGMPPPEVYDDGQSLFSIGVLLENIGESEVGVGTNSLNQQGFVEIIGISPIQFNKFDQTDLKVTWADAQLELQGARRGFDGAIIAGDTALIEISDLSYQINRYGTDEIPFRVNVCYEYRTFSDTEVCIKDNVLRNALDDTICTLSGAKQVLNSGGPVQVTAVTQNPAGANKIQITFVVENIGQGMVFAPASTQVYQSGAFGDDACPFNAGFSPVRNVVDINVNLGDQGLYDINCPLFRGTNRGELRLYQGAPATITCTITTGGQAGSRIYTDSLQIDMWYSYLDWVDSTILVRDTNVGTIDRGTNQRGDSQY